MRHGLNSAAIPSSLLEMDCFQRFDFGDLISYNWVVPIIPSSVFGIGLLIVFRLPTVWVVWKCYPHFWNWIAPDDLTSYNLRSTVIPSSFWNRIAPADLTSFWLPTFGVASFLETHCFQWFDFLQFEWHRQAILILLELHCFQCFDFLRF